MPSTPNRTRSLSIAKSASNARRLTKKRLNSILNQIILASMYNKLPAHLKSPKKNKSKR
jgi:hypothetical protein